MTEIIPEAASRHSFFEHVGGTSGIGRRTPTTDPHTWHFSRSTYTSSQIGFSRLCDTGENYSGGGPQTAQPSQMLSRFDTDFVTIPLSCWLMGHYYRWSGDSKEPARFFKCERCGRIRSASNQESKS